MADKKFTPAPPPDDVEDTAFDITSVASACECTGIGHIFPPLPDDAEDLIKNLPNLEDDKK